MFVLLITYYIDRFLRQDKFWNIYSLACPYIQPTKIVFNSFPPIVCQHQTSVLRKRICGVTAYRSFRFRDRPEDNQSFFDPVDLNKYQGFLLFSNWIRVFFPFFILYFFELELEAHHSFQLQDLFFLFNIFLIT